MEILSNPVFWVVIAVVALAVYWFWLRPWMAQNRERELTSLMDARVVTATNAAMSNYSGILGQANPVKATGSITVELDADGVLRVRSTSTDLNLYQLRNRRVAVTSGHETLCELQLSISSDALARAQVPSKVLAANANKTVRLSNLLKEETAPAVAGHLRM